jgi:hypothetical protein
MAREGKLVIDDPDIRQRLIKTIESYAAIYREGCTPSDSASSDVIDNNKTSLDPGDDAQRLAVHSQRAEARAARRLLQECCDDRAAHCGTFTTGVRRSAPGPRLHDFAPTGPDGWGSGTIYD